MARTTLSLIVGITLACCCSFALVHTLPGRRVNQPYIINRWDQEVDSRGSPFNPCDMKAGSVSAVHVSDCADTDDKCILKGGTNATIGLDFTSKVAAKSLQAVVHGIVGGIPVPFHVPHSDACTDSGVECPLKPGTAYEYSTTLPVLKSYPKLSVHVKWELTSEQGVVACVIIPAEIR